MLKPNSTVTTNLIMARELIADERNWCQKALCKLQGDHAQYCAAGAVLNVVGRSSSFPKELTVLTGVAQQLFGKIVPDVNDELGHTAVMAMFDRAIELSLQDGE